MYSHKTQETHLFANIDDKLQIQLKYMEYDVITIMPVKNGFSPIGFGDKFNSGGAILLWESAPAGVTFLGDDVKGETCHVIDLIDAGDLVAYL